MTVRFRLLLAWLMMAAVPLQGFAAASMLFCSAAIHEGGTSQAQPMAAGHHGHAGHAVHRHADETAVNAPETAASTSQAFGALPDVAHACSVCASCCHNVAITEFPSVVALAPLPRADVAQPLLLPYSRPSPIPYKPPRA